MTALGSPAACLRASLDLASRSSRLVSRTTGIARSSRAAAPVWFPTSCARLFSSRSSRAPFRYTREGPSPVRRKIKPTPSFSPSPEQQRIARLCAEHNVVVSARPGSGKTATAEAIVAAHPDKRVIVLTYSKRLQVETKSRLKPYWKRCEVLTFHALAGQLFPTVINNDRKLAEQRRTTLETGQLLGWDRERFDIIVLDEFQDCTPPIFWLVNCFIRANHAINGQPARLVVLGDERQSIYEFRGADQRYLTYAPDLLGPVSPYPFANVPLSQSFRLSAESVRFINDVFLQGEPYIKSSKPGPRPLVLRCNIQRPGSLIGVLHRLIQEHGPRNSAIIAPSIRSQTPSPLQCITNTLSRTFRVPIAVSINDEAPLDDSVIRGKLCVSTIHQFKGSERDLIILYGLDNSYFRYFGRGLPDDTCPNAVFVALTRAVKQVVLIHDEANKPMPFVSVEALQEAADVVDLTGGGADMPLPAKPRQEQTVGLELPERAGVRDVTRHIRDDLLDGIMSRHLCVTKLSAPLPDEHHIRIRNVVPSNIRRNLHEDVSDINGLVVVAAFEHYLKGTIGMFTRRLRSIPNVDSRNYPSWLCREACAYEARQSGYIPRKMQMKNHKFDWIRPTDLARARHRLQKELEEDRESLRFEVPCTDSFSHPQAARGGTQAGVDELKGLIEIRGRADIVRVSPANDKDIDTVWEIKFVSELSHQHALQACIYAYLLGIKSGKAPRIMLFNVKNGEKWEITPKDGLDGLRLVLEEALTAKYTVHERMKDEEFLEMCAGIRQEVQDLKEQANVQATGT